MHHPLADAGRQVLLGVGADRADQRNRNDCRNGKVQRGGLVGAEPGDDVALHPVRQGFAADDVVEDDFQRPGFEQVGERFAENGDEGEHERRPVRTQQLGDANLMFLHPASGVSRWSVPPKIQTHANGLRNYLGARAGCPPFLRLRNPAGKLPALPGHVDAA